ncbi:hypothetical protein PCE1_003435 [Barthelona sp. PCE]
MSKHKRKGKKRKVKQNKSVSRQEKIIRKAESIYSWYKEHTGAKRTLISLIAALYSHESLRSLKDRFNSIIYELEDVVVSLCLPYDKSFKDKAEKMWVTLFKDEDCDHFVTLGTFLTVVAVLQLNCLTETLNNGYLTVAYGILSCLAVDLNYDDEAIDFFSLFYDSKVFFMVNNSPSLARHFWMITGFIGSRLKRLPFPISLDTDLNPFDVLASSGDYFAYSSVDDPNRLVFLKDCFFKIPEESKRTLPKWLMDRITKDLSDKLEITKGKACLNYCWIPPRAHPQFYTTYQRSFLGSNSTKPTSLMRSIKDHPDEDYLMICYFISIVQATYLTKKWTTEAVLLIVFLYNQFASEFRITPFYGMFEFIYSTLVYGSDGICECYRYLSIFFPDKSEVSEMTGFIVLFLENFAKKFPNHFVMYSGFSKRRKFEKLDLDYENLFLNMLEYRAHHIMSPRPQYLLYNSLVKNDLNIERHHIKLDAYYKEIFRQRSLKFEEFTSRKKKESIEPEEEVVEPEEEVVELEEEVVEPEKEVEHIGVMTEIDVDEAGAQFSFERVAYGDIPESKALMRAVRSYIPASLIEKEKEPQFCGDLFVSDEHQQRRRAAFVYGLHSHAAVLGLVDEFPEVQAVYMLSDNFDTIARLIVLFLFGPYFKFTMMLEKEKICDALNMNHMYALAKHVEKMTVNELFRFNSSTFSELRILPSVTQTLNTVVVTYYDMFGYKITPFFKLPVSYASITRSKKWVEHTCAHSILFSRFLLLMVMNFNLDQYDSVLPKDDLFRLFHHHLKREYYVMHKLPLSFAEKHKDILVEWALNVTG